MASDNIHHAVKRFSSFPQILFEKLILKFHHFSTLLEHLSLYFQRLRSNFAG